MTGGGVISYKSGQTVENVVFTDCTSFTVGNAPSGCTFAASGQITLTGSMSDCIVDESTAASAVSVASPSVAANITDTVFNSSGTGNGIEIGGTAANITLTGLEFYGYSTTVDANKAIYVNIATGSMTITASGCVGLTTAAVRTAGCTVTVNSDVTVTFTGVKDYTNILVQKVSDGSTIAESEDHLDTGGGAQGGTTDNRTFSFAATATTEVRYILHNHNPNGPDYLTIRVNSYSVPSADTSITINQLIDRNTEPD
jgi:hypothetical protein